MLGLDILYDEEMLIISKAHFKCFYLNKFETTQVCFSVEQKGPINAGMARNCTPSTWEVKTGQAARANR